MKNMYLLRGLKLILSSIGILCLIATPIHAATYTLVKTIDLNPLLGDDGAIEVDVVGNELYVANWIQDKYFRIDPVTSNLLGSFALSNGILMDNHGSEYDPTNGLILHVSDREAGGSLTYDAYFATNTNGVVVQGPYPLYGPGSQPELDPNALTVDPVTGRVWVSTVSNLKGITEINPQDGTVLNRIDLGGGAAWALGFNPNSGKLFFADDNGVIWEINPDGTGMRKVFDPGVGWIYGMAFTPTGDLVILDFAAPSYGIPGPSRLLLYDSSDDADDVFTTAIPTLIDIKPARINLRKTSEISVAILSTVDFDAPGQIDQYTLTFGRTGSEVSWAYCDSKPKDVNKDGFKDLLCYFYTDHTGFQCGDNVGILNGYTVGGVPIKGSDSAKIVQCK